MAIASTDSSAFRHHVDRHLEPLRADLGAKRRDAWKQLVLRAIISIVLIVGVAGSGWWTHRPEDEFYWWLLTFVVLAFGVALSFWCTLPWFKHRDRLKHDVLTRLVPFLGDFSYRPEGALSLTEFDDSGLLPKYNKQCVEDEVTGSHRGVALRAADVQLRFEYDTRSSHGSGRSREVEKVFEGVLLALEMPTPAACDVLIGTTICFEGRFAIKGDEWQRFELPRGDLEAWTRDPKACARVLNAELVDRVAALVSRGGVRRWRIAWHRTTLAMLLDFGEDFFELPFRGEIDFRRYGEIVARQLGHLTRFIDMLGASATVPSADSSRSLEERMRQAKPLAKDFEAVDRGCLPMVVFTSLGFCIYLWLLMDEVRPLGALGLALVFGVMAGFGLANALFGERKRKSALKWILVGLLGITPAIPNETLDRLPGGQYVKAIKLESEQSIPP